MARYDFTIIAAGSPELTDELADRLFAAGADDCSPGTCGEVLSIDFHRDADSFEQAARSAIAHLQAAGLTAARVVMEADAVALKI